MATFCGNATLEVCRVDDGQVLFQIPIRSTRKSLNEGDPLLNLQRFEMAFTPDSKSIAFCDDDGVHMRLVDLELANQELTKMGLGW